MRNSAIRYLLTSYQKDTQMAHALSIRQTGKAEMAYVGQTPWHKLGQQLPSGASLDVWSQAAGMDWMIESSPVQFTVNGQMHQMPDRVVLYRSDNQFALSSVSRWYKPVHPSCIPSFCPWAGVGMKESPAATGFPKRIRHAVIAQ